MYSFRSLLVVTGSLIALLSQDSASSSRPADTEKAAADLYRTELLKAAAEYKSWGRVDDGMRLRWAPENCRAPQPRPQPSQVYFSASKDDKTHGQKLYSLFARNRSAYLFLRRDTTVEIGQAIVKQSWLPEEITDPKERPGKEIDHLKIIRTLDSSREPVDIKSSRIFDNIKTDHFYPYVWKGEKVFKATKQADLFIMVKLDAKTPGTDAGWVYGTVTPDGQKVTSAGKIESCMQCHREAKSDRLFGLRR